MTAIVNGEYEYLWKDNTGKESFGGTELLTSRLAKEVPKELLEKFWIVSSRVPAEMPDDKIRVLWLHDLPGDPAVKQLADPNFVAKWHKFVFVSNWQMQAFIGQFNLPYDKCCVIQNAIDPIDVQEKPTDEIRLVYHPTPRRGLNILAVVFEELCKKYDNIRLDVFSSHALYGWDEADEPFKDIFQMLDNNPKVHNHGTVDNDTIREYLSKAHIFAYPSTYLETSCLCLMEAMSAKTICVHSDIGALFETAANWTQMYHYVQDSNEHAGIFYNVLCGVIENVESMLANAQSQKAYADVFYNWQNRRLEWEAMLTSLVNTVKDTSIPDNMFTIKTGT